MIFFFWTLWQLQTVARSLVLRNKASSVKKLSLRGRRAKGEGRKGEGRRAKGFVAIQNRRGKGKDKGPLHLAVSTILSVLFFHLFCGHGLLLIIFETFFATLNDYFIQIFKKAFLQSV